MRDNSGMTGNPVLAVDPSAAFRILCVSLFSMPVNSKLLCDGSTLLPAQVPSLPVMMISTCLRYLVSRREKGVADCVSEIWACKEEGWLSIQRKISRADPKSQ